LVLVCHGGWYVTQKHHEKGNGNTTAKTPGATRKNATPGLLSRLLKAFHNL